MGFDLIGNSGNKVRFSVHTWPSVTGAIEAAGLPVPDDWESNDGAGLSTQTQCNTLADKLGILLKSNKIIMVPKITKLGAWTQAYVKTLSEEETSTLFEARKKGNKPHQWIDGKPAYLITITPEDIPEDIRRMAEKDIDVCPWEPGEVKRFIAFLRECDGFEIW